MEFIGFFFALFIGFSIGLFGGGGSILSVPVLAYLFLLDEKISTAYSLFIVGVTALLGGVKQNFNKNELDVWQTVKNDFLDIAAEIKNTLDDGVVDERSLPSNLN